VAKKKEVTMATAKGEFNEYCDTLFSELTDMRSRVSQLIEGIEEMPVKSRIKLMEHVPHLEEIMRVIDWKLEIIGRVCPYEWKGFGADVESTVSVESTETEIQSGGYIGG
jgi:hypothetical protein